MFKRQDNRMKTGERFTKWSIRRLSVGVASVAIASGFFVIGGLGNSQIVHADVIDSPSSIMQDSDDSLAKEANANDATTEVTEKEQAMDSVEKTQNSGDTVTDTNDDVSSEDDKLTSDASENLETPIEEKVDTSAEEEVSSDDLGLVDVDSDKSLESSESQTDSSETVTPAVNTENNLENSSSTFTDRSAVSTGEKIVDTNTHYTASGIEDSTLRYANTVFDSVKDDGTIHLTVTKWATGATGWGTDTSNPYAGKYLLSFTREEFYSQIESITIKSNANLTNLVSESNGALWTVPISTTTVQSGLIGVVTNHDVTITLKNGQPLTSLGLADDKLGFSSVWVKKNGSIAKESISNGFIQQNNAHINKSDSDKQDSSFLGTNTGVMGNKVLFDANSMVINSVHNFKPNENFLQSNYTWILYIMEQIPKDLLPYIDLDNIELGVSDISGNFQTKNPIKLKADSNGLVDSRNSPEISIINNDTRTQLDAARTRLDKDVFYGTLGQSRNYTIKYHLKDSVTLAEFAKAMNDYIKNNNQQLTFESWLESDYLNSGRPLLDKPDGGADTKELLHSYANGYLDVNDSDKDGLFDFVEFQIQSDINKVDTDGDGVPDGQEYLIDNTDILDAKSYKVAKPTTSTTVINNAASDTVIQGTVPKVVYTDPSDDSKSLNVTNTDAGEVIVKLVKQGTDSVVAQTTIPFKDLLAGNFELTIPKGTLQTGDKLQLVAYSPDGKQHTDGDIITVDNRSDADKYTPNVEDETVDFGGKVDLTDNVTNLGDLPSGTTVTDVTKTPIDTTQPGDYTGTIEVTYPDGSKETIDVPVHVVDNRSDADKSENSGGNLIVSNDDNNIFPNQGASHIIPTNNVLINKNSLPNTGDSNSIVGVLLGGILIVMSTLLGTGNSRKKFNNDSRRDK